LSGLAIVLAVGGCPQRALASTLFELAPADPFAAGTLFSDLQHPREAASYVTLIDGAAIECLVWWGGYFSFDEVPNPGASPFEIRLFADTGSGPAEAPFVVAAVTATVTPFPASLPQFEYAASLAQPIVLAPGTYWISIVDVDPANPTFAWRKSAESFYSFSRVPGDAWSLTSGLASVRLEGVLVPEPGTAALAALGLTLLCARSRSARLRLAARSAPGNPGAPLPGRR